MNSFIRMPNRPLRFLGSILLVVLAASGAGADALDGAVAAAIDRYAVPGLSLAVIEHGRIVRAQGFGLRDLETKEPVTPETLFQAGSASKPIAAMAALKLVDRGDVSLDTDVNGYLKSRKLPENDFTRARKVTLRELLSHTAGVTVHGFPGYARWNRIPTLPEVLDGELPARTPPIRVDAIPGGKWRYSGGGYTIVQQLVVDVTGRPFPSFLRETVLQPLGMTRSTYEQPLPTERIGEAAKGYFYGGTPVRGGWHVFPEMAEAGLWTTPTDLARFTLAFLRSDEPSGWVLSPPTARLMLVPVLSNYALGFAITGRGKALHFGHGGRNEGFDTMMVGYPATGQGAWVMINENSTEAINEVLMAIGARYAWPLSSG
jgi:CubicO group peptidase (beta-lactamase class C family)